jgi:hypothetical protein
LSGRDRVGTDSVIFWKCSSLFLCTGRWPWEHLHIRSVQAEAHAKGLSKRMLAREHLRVRSVSMKDRTPRTGLWLNTVQLPVTLTWQCTVRSGRTGRWPAFGHGAPDASGQRFHSLDPL